MRLESSGDCCSCGGCCGGCCCSSSCGGCGAGCWQLAAAAAPAVVATAAVAVPVLPLPAGGGAVTGADTVAIDCRYGPCKSSVSVMKISKRIKEKKKETYRGLETQMRLESSIPIQQSPQRRCPQLVGDCRYGRCAFGRTWWWEGERTREARVHDERKFNITT